MKVSDLRDLLADFDQDAEVVFQYNYGDYWHTVVAATISSVGDGHVVYSQYHNMDKLVSVEDDEGMSRELPPDARAVVLLG